MTYIFMFHMDISSLDVPFIFVSKLHGLGHVIVQCLLHVGEAVYVHFANGDAEFFLHTQTVYTAY